MQKPCTGEGAYYSPTLTCIGDQRAPPALHLWCTLSLLLHRPPDDASTRFHLVHHAMTSPPARPVVGRTLYDDTDSLNSHAVPRRPFCFNRCRPYTLQNCLQHALYLRKFGRLSSKARCQS